MDAKNTTSARFALEDLWLTRVYEALATYKSASAEFTRILTDQKSAPLPAPDGSLSVRQARMAESSARAEYMRIMKIFADLTIHGTIPD